MSKRQCEEIAESWAAIADDLRRLSDGAYRNFFSRPRRDLIRDAQNEAARYASKAQEAAE